MSEVNTSLVEIGVLFRDGQGRFVEVYADGESFEIGRISVWDPPRRLVFGFRGRHFARGETTEVEVRFAPSGSSGRPIDVTIEHRGWASLRGDHPARHGMEGAAFVNMMGAFWADLLTAARGFVDGRREDTR